MESKIKKFPQYPTNLYERKFTAKTNDAHHEENEGRAKMPLRTSAMGVTPTHRKSHQEATRWRKAIQGEPQEHHHSSNKSIMTKTELNTLAEEIAKRLFARMQEQKDTYLDIDGAAEFLHISKRTLYNKRHVIPSVKVGGKRLYSTITLTRYVQNGGLIK